MYCVAVHRRPARLVGLLVAGRRSLRTGASVHRGARPSAGAGAWLVRASKLIRRASAAGVFGLDQVQVVDAGRPAAGVVGLLGAGFAVHVPADDLRAGQPHRLAVVPHFDAGQIERVEDELDDPADQERVDLVGVAEQADLGGLADLPVHRPQERLGQLRRGGLRRTAPRPATGPAAVCPVPSCTRRW